MKKKLGSGAYGIVWKVVERQSGQCFALKKNFDAFQNSTDAQRTYREVMFLQRFCHPNIVQLREVIRSASDKDIYILFELMDIDLYSLIREDLLKEQHRRFIAYQVAKALHYLHSADLIHRDIKPSNILVNEHCLAKLCDFGLVRSVEEDQPEEPLLTDYIATRWYRAPEILLGSKKYSKAADVWSFGCLLGELLTGKPMFPGHSTLNQIERVLTWTGPPTIQDLQALKTDFGQEMLELLTKIKPLSRKQWAGNCSAEGYDLLCKALSFNPERRPSMLDIARHPYLREFFSRKEMLECEAKIRVEVSDNTKLSLKEYRALIYRMVEECELRQGEAKGLVRASQLSCLAANSTAKTLCRPRAGKAVRSASKGKEEPAKSGHKESNTVNVKKYGSYLRKDELFRTKYART